MFAVFTLLPQLPSLSSPTSTAPTLTYGAVSPHALRGRVGGGAVIEPYNTTTQGLMQQAADDHGLGIDVFSRRLAYTE